MNVVIQRKCIAGTCTQRFLIVGLLAANWYLSTARNCCEQPCFMLAFVTRFGVTANAAPLDLVQLVSCSEISPSRMGVGESHDSLGEQLE